jgi:hypothetical protein
MRLDGELPTEKQEAETKARKDQLAIPPRTVFPVRTQPSWRMAHQMQFGPGGTPVPQQHIPLLPDRQALRFGVVSASGHDHDHDRGDRVRNADLAGPVRTTATVRLADFQA